MHDAYGPFLSTLASAIPQKLHLLKPQELMSTFYGLTCLGPQIREVKLRNARQGQHGHQLMDTLVGHALEVVNELNGADRCQLMEGMVLVNQRLGVQQIECLLGDADPLFESREGVQTVHPSSLATLLWAIGKHNCSDYRSLVATCLEELCHPKSFVRLGVADMGRTVWALHRLRVQSGHKAFLKRVQRHLQFTVDVGRRHMWNSEVVEFAEGLTSMQSPGLKRNIMAYLVKDMAQRRTPLTPQQRERFLTACQAIDYPIRATLSTTARTDSL